jgi:hypothetical protein
MCCRCYIAAALIKCWASCRWSDELNTGQTRSSICLYAQGQLHEDLAEQGTESHARLRVQDLADSSQTELQAADNNLASPHGGAALISDGTSDGTLRLFEIVDNQLSHPLATALVSAERASTLVEGAAIADDAQQANDCMIRTKMWRDELTAYLAQLHSKVDEVRIQCCSLECTWHWLHTSAPVSHDGADRGGVSYSASRRTATM